MLDMLPVKQEHCFVADTEGNSSAGSRKRRDAQAQLIDEVNHKASIYKVRADVTRLQRCCCSMYGTGFYCKLGTGA